MSRLGYHYRLFHTLRNFWNWEKIFYLEMILFGGDFPRFESKLSMFQFRSEIITLHGSPASYSHPVCILIMLCDNSTSTLCVQTCWYMFMASNERGQWAWSPDDVLGWRQNILQYVIRRSLHWLEISKVSKSISLKSCDFSSKNYFIEKVSTKHSNAFLNFENFEICGTG